MWMLLNDVAFIRKGAHRSVRTVESVPNVFIHMLGNEGMRWMSV